MNVCSIDEEGRFGGPEKRIIEIAAALKKTNINTHVLYPKLDSDRFTFEIKKLKIQSTAFFLTRLSKEKRILFRYIVCFFYEIFLLYKFLRKNKFDLVQINGSQQFKGAIAAGLANIPIVWVLEDTMMDKRVKKICSFLINKYSSGIIVVASRVYDFYIRGTRLEQKPCIEINSSVNTLIFDPKNTLALENKEFEDKTIITTVSGINPTKGIEYFLEMAKMIMENHQDVMFLIAGAKLDSHSKYSKFIDNLIFEKGLKKHIVFLGLFDNIPSLLKTSDIFICSSISEASPTAVWEAMAMEKAIVSTDVGSVNKFIVDGLSGFIVPPKDSEKLYKKVDFLLKNPSVINKLGRNARKVAKEKLDISFSANNYNYFYKKILQTVI